MEQQAKTALEEFGDAEDANEAHLAKIKLAASRSGSSGYVLEINPIMVGAEATSKLTFRAQRLADGRAAMLATAEDASVSYEEYLIAALTGLDIGVVGQFDWEDFEAAKAVLDGITRRRVGGLIPMPTDKVPPERAYRALAKAHDEWLAKIKLAAARAGAGGYLLELYTPIDVKGESAKRAGLLFRPQTLRDMREAKRKMRRGVMVDDLLASDLCGVPVAELGQLEWEDWEAVQAVLEGFARRRAVGGPAQKV